MTFVLIDNSLETNGRCHVFEKPAEIVIAQGPGDVAAAVARLEHGMARGLTAAGFFAYELGYVLEPRLNALLPPNRDLPLLWFGLFEDGEQMTSHEANSWLKDFADASDTGGYDIRDLHPATTRQAYLKSFAQVQKKITAGDIYQMNLTFKSRFQLQGCPVALYRDLRAKQKVAYGALIKTDDFAVLSVSPELFLERRGRNIVTRPMKGTSARGSDAASDRQAREALASDEKQRAENLMIVDLMRNDLGRISEIGSVRVEDLFKVESYPTLHQMTTTVRAKARGRLALMDLLTALFPPGSITGAPKIRAMELIRAYERAPRGVYTGAIGMISPNGDARFNVAIRTAVVTADGRGEIGIGSGVVADSVADEEYAECLLKMKFFTDQIVDFQLIETLLYDGRGLGLYDGSGLELFDGLGRGLGDGAGGRSNNGNGSGYYLLCEHMARLAKSAREFRFNFDAAEVRARLLSLVKNRPNDRLRVRLLMSRDGTISLSATAQPAPLPGKIIRYVIAPRRLQPDDIYLQHKTTRRRHFDEDFARSAAEGADEVIYFNERLELCEGSRTTIFLEKRGQLSTPALQSGLLPGTLRAFLLRSGKVVERVLAADDLAAADAVYLGNGLRGLQKALPWKNEG